MNRPDIKLPYGLWPRSQAVYVCDKLYIMGDDTEVLVARKFYERPGPAKAYRTNGQKTFARNMKSVQAGSPLGRAYVYNGQRVHGIRMDAYVITPNGYEDL